MSDLLKNTRVLPSLFGLLADGVRAEYIEPIERLHERMQTLSQHARRYRPKEAFLRTFTNQNSYGQFLEESTRASELGLELASRMGKLPENKMRLLQQVLRRTAPLMREFSERVFGNLYTKKE